MLEEIINHHVLDHTLTHLSVFGLNLPVTKHLIMMWICGAIMLLGFPIILYAKSRPLRLARTALEWGVVFIRDEIVIANMGEEGRPYTPYFCTLFFFILLLNMAGLVPFSATATGNVSVTGGLALTTFLLINILGIKQNGFVHYMKSFVPEGVPKWLYPLLYPIEVFGLITKSFALCIRLFANMVGGHIVLLSFISMIFIFSAINVYAGVFLAIPFEIPMALFVTCLELFVAFLQAYIFTFLTAIFTGAAMHPH